VPIWSSFPGAGGKESRAILV
jgi:hypothetical protein